MVRLPQNEKQTYRLMSRPQMWPSSLTLVMILTMNFQGQIWNLLYLSQKWSDCHETKSRHINWTLGLKCDQIWPWPSPWPWIFKVKYGIFYISTKSGPIASKRKAKYWLNSRPQMWPMHLTLTMTLTFEFSRSNVILTIWWPRSGIRIYQIGTGVTSDVGVPSTRLVRFWSPSVHFTYFGGILTQLNISNVWFPYLMENAWQLQYFSKPGDTFLVFPGRRNATACPAWRRLGLPCAALPGQARRTQTHALGR